MKQGFKWFILVVMAMALAFSCSSDGTDSLSTSDLEGTWDVTEYRYISKANTSVSVDLLATFNVTITMTVTSNGNYTISGSISGQPFSSSGTFEEDGNDLTTNDPDISANLDGNTLTFIIDNQQWDFGNGLEPATLRNVYRKR